VFSFCIVFLMTLQDKQFLMLVIFSKTLNKLAMLLAASFCMVVQHLFACMIGFFF